MLKRIINFKKPVFWMGAITIMLLVTISIWLLTIEQSDPDSKVETKDDVVQSEEILHIAEDTINRDISNYESNPEVNIIDSRITRLELIESFDGLADSPIGVYALEYRLLPEDLSKVVLAGGMQLDEDNWLKETNSMGSPLLVVSHKFDLIELIGTLWTGGVLEEGGLESSIKDLLKPVPISLPISEFSIMDTSNRNIISPSVSETIKVKIQGSIASMKEMGPGVGPWNIVYYNIK